MEEIVLNVTIRGNASGYYGDIAEMGEAASLWIDGALYDRDDISSWEIVQVDKSNQVR